VSGQSAKRYGLDVKGDLELESRLRRIELELGKLARGNEDAVVQSRGQGAVPQVTGLRLGGQIPGGLTILWNAVSISDLRRYDVQFATNLAFTVGFQAFVASTTTYPFTTATEGGAVYFARVRAINSNRRNGAWSAILNTATGQVASADLADGAVDTASIQDGAVTVEKNDPESVAALDPADGLPGQGVVVNSTNDAFDFIDLPSLSGIAASTNAAVDGENKQGVIKFPGGLKVQFDTVTANLNSTTTVTLPEAYTEAHYTVIGSLASALGTGVTEDILALFVPSNPNTLTSVKIRSGANTDEEVTYISIGKDTS